MAIKKAFENYAGWGSVSIPVAVGESILIKDIHMNLFGNACSIVRMYVDSVQVGEIYVDSSHGNPLMITKNLYQKNTLLKYLFDRGLWRGIPVEEGQTFKVEAYNQTGAFINVIYEVHDAADLKSTDPNGSEAVERDLITYGGCGISQGGDTKVDTQQWGRIVGGFPYQDKVPPAYEVAIKGVLFQDIYKSANTGANKIKTLYLKFVKNREVLFTRQLYGLLYMGDQTQTGDGTFVGLGVAVGGVYTDKNVLPPFIFPEPLVCAEGESLDLYIGSVILAGSPTLNPTETMIGLIVTQKRLR